MCLFDKEGTLLLEATMHIHKGRSRLKTKARTSYCDGIHNTGLLYRLHGSQMSWDAYRRRHI